jgi:hypothetical protein
MLTLTPGAGRRIRREARSETLRERALALRQAGWTLQAIAVAIGVSRTRVQQILRKGERLVLDPHWYDFLPMRAQNYLRTSGLAELPELEAARAVAQMSRRELLATPNMGRGACSALVAWLAGHGLRPQLEINLKAAKQTAAVAETAAGRCRPSSPNERAEQCSDTPATGSRQHG